MRTSTRYGPPLANARPIAGAISGAFSTRSPGTPIARAMPTKSMRGSRSMPTYRSSSAEKPLSARVRCLRIRYDALLKITYTTASGSRVRAPREVRALALPADPHRLRPTAGVRMALRARQTPHRLAELGQGRLRVALDRHGGGIVLAELPRVDVEMDDREAGWHRVHVVGEREGEEVPADREEQIVTHQEGADRWPEARHGPGVQRMGEG